MTLSKTTLTISSIALALMFGGGVFLLMNFGDIAKTIAQKVASETLGVTVSIGKIDIALADKAVTVSNIKIGNPKGYKGPYAATIDTIHMKAQTFSQTLLKFNDISVSGTEIYLEVRQTGTNLSDIKKTVDSKARKGDKAAQQIKVIIENMKIEKMQVNPSVLLPGLENMKPIIVPDLVLRGIGVKENGVLAQEAIGQIWSQLSKSVSAQANSAGFYQGISPEALQDIGVKQIDVLKENLKKEMDNLEEGIKGLFGN